MGLGLMEVSLEKKSMKCSESLDKIGFLWKSKARWGGGDGIEGFEGQTVYPIGHRGQGRCGQGGRYQLKTGVTYQLQLLSDFFLCIYGKLGVLHFLDPRLLGQLIHIQPNVPGSCIGKPRNHWATASRQWVSSEKRPIFSEPLAQRPVGTFGTATLTNGRRRGSVVVVASPHSQRALSSSPQATASNWRCASHPHCTSVSFNLTVHAAWSPRFLGSKW